MSIMMRQTNELSEGFPFRFISDFTTVTLTQKLIVASLAFFGLYII